MSCKNITVKSLLQDIVERMVPIRLDLTRVRVTLEKTNIDSTVLDVIKKAYNEIVREQEALVVASMRDDDAMFTVVK
jgi:hypothetical protein